ncbi:DUF952 domain-containing protein [Rubellimicrobium roseum]|uniref:DUF952 domain-containing protein n=1 Tax=Rubellimicrobium roseum TaxID=687525 RepID=A0A5C4NBU5_9RHOB|nr:DUF952 domain-containing protein [Rubellimicrobium roseum]TNC71512.1 DUF952 domain-containing protein [Rubellimicrobium roseum]
MAIYKILRTPEWEALQAAGHSLGAPVDLQDGYVHLSTAAQVEETVAKHFAGEEGLVLLAVDETRLVPELRWEPSRGGQLFPHLYRELRMADVIWSAPLPLDGGRHRFPPL